MEDGYRRNVPRYGYVSISKDDCSYVGHIAREDRCEWVRNTHSCHSDSILQYTQLLFCTFNSENAAVFICGLIILLLWLAYLFLILGTTADNFFCPSLAVIAGILHMSENIAGVTILAFGNGAPDIFTSLVSGSEKSIIMFTELIGAGVFVTSIIAGSVTVAKPFRVHLKPLIRDTCSYIFAIVWISCIVADEIVYLWEAVSLVGIYVLFIVVVVTMQVYETREENLKKRIPSVSDPDVLHTYLANKDIRTIPRISMRPRPFGLGAKIDVAIATELERIKSLGTVTGIAEETMEEGTFGRPRGLLKEFFYDINPIDREDWKNANWLVKAVLLVRSPFMFLMQLFIPVVDGTAVKRGWSKLLNCFQLCVTPTLALFLLNVWRTTIGGLPILPIFLLAGTVIGVIVFLTTRADRVPMFHNVFAFLGFLAGMLTVYLTAGEVIAVLQSIGYACSISDAMLGITFLAWGNSIGDLVSNITIAKRGFPRMGFAACFGGPMFNTLLGLGLTYGMNAARNPNWQIKIRVSNMAPGYLAFLLYSLISSVIYLNVTGALARRSYGYLLYSIYCAFFLVNILSETHIIHPLGTDHHDDID